jgi:hypothetical protein
MCNFALSSRKDHVVEKNSPDWAKQNSRLDYPKKIITNQG